MGRFDTILYATLFSVLLLTALPAKATDEQRRRFTGESRNETFPAVANGTITVSSYEGEIRVTVWQRDEVMVSVDGVNSDDLGELEIREDGDRITVDYRPRNRRWASRARFRVDLPADYNLDLKTGTGEIEVTGEIRG